MRVADLALTDFRSYHEVAVQFAPGPNVLIGANGQGKTNLVEAVGYLATLSSHRVSQDAALVRSGCTAAVIRALFSKEQRTVSLDVQITPGKANKARINRSPATKVRDLLGIAKVVIFSPEDLALIKGDPGERRRFLDEIMVQWRPRLAGVRQDYDRVVRQRTALLKSAYQAKRHTDLSTLDVWDGHLARSGALIMQARAAIVAQLRPLACAAYREVAAGRGDLTMEYKTSVDDGLPPAPMLETGAELSVEQWEELLLAGLRQVREKEIERGVCLVGPHRDEVVVNLNALPAKLYASHGETWSAALALRLASFDMMSSQDQDQPILILDDVFAELDVSRRTQLAQRVSGIEQVLITAAVPHDVPAQLQATVFQVADGQVTRE